MRKVCIIAIFSIISLICFSITMPVQVEADGDFASGLTDALKQEASSMAEKAEEKIPESDSDGSSSGSVNTKVWDPRSDKDNIDEKALVLELKVKTILGAIRAIGIIISVGALMIIGIRTMVGSVEEKAHYKQAMLGYVIGAIMVFAVTTIPSVIYDFATKLNG